MDMKGMKVRYDAWAAIAMVAEVGYDVRNIPPGPDGWHSHASVGRWVVAQLQADEIRRGITPRPDAGTTSQPGARMTPQAAFDSGRITAQSRTDWEQRYTADPAGVGETLASLAPVLSAAHQAAHPPKTAAEELDEIDDALFGVGHSELSRQRQRARLDEQALTQFREIERQEQETANQPDLTDDEFRQMYGRDREN
jgi:hypothetical protein